MADRFELITRAHLDRWNDAVRAASPTASAGQRVAIAKGLPGTDGFFVGPRTADRWFTSAGQRRNCVPRSVVGHTWEQIAEPPFRRLVLGMLEAEGISQPYAGEGKVERYHVPVGALLEACNYAADLCQGGIDPWLAAAWGTITMRWNGYGEGWTLTITYKRGVPGFGSP